MSVGPAGGADFPPIQVTAILALACTAGLVPTLQPLILGALSAEGRLTAVQIGQAAMLEAIGMGVSAGLAGSFLKPVRLRRLIVVTLLLGLIANLSATQLAGPGLLVARFMCGISSGLLVWLFAGLTARAVDPTRVGGMYVLAQGASGLAAAALLTAFALPRWGGAGGYFCLAGLDVVMLSMAAIAPMAYPDLASGEAGRKLEPRGAIALLAAFLHLAAIMALWVYIVPVAEQTGQSAGVTGIGIWAALGAQILAGLVAALYSARLRPAPALILCSIVSVAAIAQIAAGPPSALFIAAATVFGFFWMFAIPFQIPFLIQVDPTRKAALILPSAQIFGVAAGPAIAAWTIVDGSVMGALWASAGLFAASMALMLFLSLRRRVAATASP
ncbi:MAG: hypothetical protein Q8M88_13465 [Phenylobacterium sp.]|uniref:hypothetical protein n=1 Tax=Phenylobacterium sp. TaxID=1871053 RepID=UPI002736F514|nr:hypothetical protein [Phenylobacterium sp.]MDP3175436.1 hypothetical protein [Phenylobacterium sp.]